MAGGVIGQMCAISIGLAVVTPGGSFTPGSYASIKGIAKKIKGDTQIKKINTDAMGDASELYRGGKASGTLSIDCIVNVTGWEFLTTGNSPVGMVATVEIKTLSSLASYTVYQGLVEKWGWTINDDEAQMENISIAIGADIS